MPVHSNSGLPQNLPGAKELNAHIHRKGLSAVWFLKKGTMGLRISMHQGDSTKVLDRPSPVLLWVYFSIQSMKVLPLKVQLNVIHADLSGCAKNLSGSPRPSFFAAMFFHSVALMG